MSGIASTRYAPFLLRFGLVAFVVACQCQDPSKEATVTASAPEAPAQGATEIAWHSLEQRRDLAGTLQALSGSLPAAARIAGARALARIGGVGARERLREMLADEDLEVVRWAAFGLAQSGSSTECTAEPTALVDELVSRSASIHALAEPSAQRTEALQALAMALGRCGAPRAEEALRAWLTHDGELAECAAWGLGQLATHHGRLSEESQVALLTFAAQRQSAAALFPFTRLTRLADSVRARLLEVSGQAITEPAGLRRSFAVRALSAAGPAAAEPLARILQNTTFSSEERAMAAQALRQLGQPGQRALAKAISQLPVPALSALQGLGSSDAQAPNAQAPDALTTARPSLESSLVWRAALQALESPGSAKERLRELAQLDLPAPTNALGRRRALEIRCRAAELLAGSDAFEPLLQACDPDASEVGARALLEVLDRAPLEGRRLEAWRPLVTDSRPVVRQAALRLLASHSEVTDSARLLEQAVAGNQLGTAVTGLRLLAAYPARGSSSEHGKQVDVDARLVEALERVLRREDWVHAIEARASALDAIAALGVLSLKKQVEEHCASPHYELRQHAERALGLLGDPKRRCSEQPVWPRETAPPAGPVRLELESDLGVLRLHLDGAAAPAAVRRITELARSGYYDGLAVHRVVEGFVVQFGDAPGDGFGDPQHAPLPCERSPAPFEALDVGMAIAGQDTASTQWFVALARYPQLDGAYTRIGRAEGPWNLLAPGDRIRAVRVKAE